MEEKDDLGERIMRNHQMNQKSKLQTTAETAADNVMAAALHRATNYYEINKVTDLRSVEAKRQQNLKRETTQSVNVCLYLR